MWSLTTSRVVRHCDGLTRRELLRAGTVGLGGELLSRTFPRAGTPLRTVPVLTSRERDVLTLLGRGIGTAGIAAQLLLSRNTVRNHVQNILTKLGAHSTLKAIALARENGLIE